MLTAAGLESKIKSELKSLQVTKKQAVPKFKTENGANVEDGTTTLESKSPLPDDVIEMIAKGVGTAVIDYIKANMEFVMTAQGSLPLTATLPILGGGIPGPVPIISVPFTLTGGSITVPPGAVL